MDGGKGMRTPKGLGILSVLLLLHVWALAEPAKTLSPAGIRRWDFVQEPALYASGGWLFVWNEEDAAGVLRGHNLEGRERILRLPRGQGPGELLLLRGLVLRDGVLTLWDAQARRLTRFRFSDGGFLGHQKQPGTGMMSRLLDMEGNNPVYLQVRPDTSSAVRALTQEVDGGSLVAFGGVGTGEFSMPRLWSLQIPLLLVDLNDTCLAWADSTCYRIILQPRDGSSGRVIEQALEGVPWSSGIQALFESMNRTQAQMMKQGPPPQRVQPLLALALSGHRLAVCRNDLIEEDRALVDFYTLEGELLGQARLPALFIQYVARSPVPFPPGFVLVDDHHLGCLHYNHQEDLYRVALYRF